MSNSLPPSKFGAGYVYGRPAPPTPQAEPVDYPVMSDETPARVVPPTTYPRAAASPGYPPATPPATPQPVGMPQAPVALPAVATPTVTPGGGAAIAAGVLALVIGIYRAFKTYVYFSVVAIYSGVPSELSSYTNGVKAYSTITAIVSAIGTAALFVGAVMLFNRRLGGRSWITLGCLIAIADVVVMWIVVFQFVKGISSFTSSLVGDYGESSDGIASSVLSEQLPSIIISIAFSVGLPLLTMILARSRSTRLWCEAPRAGVPVATYGHVQPAQPSWSQPNNQPWQQNYATPAPEVTPRQPSTPIAGWGEANQPAHADPHAEYHRQAAEHFGAAYQRPTPSRPTYGARRPGGDGENIVTRLMDRGMRGELFQQPWFLKLRAESPDQFVYVSYGVGFFISILLALIPSMFVSTVLSDLLWLAIGYLYFALGTKLAHQFLEFGICVVGALVMLGRIWSVVSTMAVTNSMARMLGASVEPTALLLLELLLNVAGAALLVYVGVQVHKRIQGLSAS